MQPTGSPQSALTNAHTPNYVRQRKELMCQYCMNVYSRAEHLVRHERSAHTKERPFQCSLCDKDFSRRDSLLRHLRKMHKDVALKFQNSLLSRKGAADLPSSPKKDAEDETSASASRSNQQMDIRTILRDERDSLPDAEVDMPDIIPPVPPRLSSNDLWDPGNASSSQPWWLQHDLNLEAFDTSLFDFSNIDERWFQPLNSHSNAIPVDGTDTLQSQSPTTQSEHLADDRVQKAWFTHVAEVDDAQNMENTHSERLLETSNSFELGNSFRAKACQRLTTQQNADPLPSIGLLNVSLRTYFTKFAPLFPIIHSHTFRPSRENSFLLLIMCSIGSLLNGDDAASHGIKMFERFNKALLASWETTLLSSPKEAISMIQAAFLGQVFGLLSGNPKHLAVVEAFHGTIVAWARRCNMFRYEHKDLGSLELSEGKLDEAWVSWARSESTLRTVLGLYIIDSHLATVFHHDPLLRHDGIEIHGAADDKVFNSATAFEWRNIMFQNIQSQTPLYRCLHINQPDHAPLQPPEEELPFKRSRFTGYFVLQSISARVSELQRRDQLQYGSRRFQELSDTLLCWYSTFERDHYSQRDQIVDDLDLLVLWYTTFMNLLTNFDKLERALGREGPNTPSVKDDIAYAIAWAASTSADRCILHAQAIQQILIEMRLSTEPAIHTAHCGFLAGIASYSAMHFRRPRMRVCLGSTYPPSTSHSPSEFPEFNVRGRFTREHLDSVAPILFQNAIGEQLLRTVDEPRMEYHVGSDIFRQCVDALQRMGHCGHARKYADTLMALIHVEIEKWMLDGSFQNSD